ncbi:MAG: hypothetical protein JW819_05585 [Candidatus Krumholzibacteriota bacterium]|nr:hypothetical protein [Candidatus Krumholzibacteriota bacterium]
MSKTFKALQRAARERDGQRSASRAADPEAGASPAPEALPEPDEVALPSRTDAAPAPLPADAPPAEGAAGDAILVTLLSENLAPADPRRPLRVTPDGRVLGDPDRERARALLARYALLHCLRERSGGAWTWFWAGGPEARERASREGLLLDEDGLA